MTADFARLETLFASLLKDTNFSAGSSHRDEVQEFIDHGEYGVALQTFIDIYAEEKKAPSEKVVQLTTALAEAMSLDPAALWRRRDPVPSVKL